MKIASNGIVREMTEEEATQMEQMQAQTAWEETHGEPTQLDKIEAQTMYTALMTDTLIEEE